MATGGLFQTTGIANLVLISIDRQFQQSHGPHGG